MKEATLTSPDRRLTARIKTTDDTTEAFRSLWRDTQATAGRSIEQDSLLAAMVIVSRSHYSELVKELGE